MASPFIQNYIVPLKRLDKLVLCFHLVLLFTGVLFIYGAGKEIGGDFAMKWIHQIQWIVAGFIVYLACASLDYHKLGKISWCFYLFSLLLLILVLIFGLKINNARSWLRIGGVTIQPSEFAKPATLLFLSWAVTHPSWHKSPIPSWVLVAAIILPPMVLVMCQPDYGTALVFIPFSIAISVLKGLKWRWILLTGIILLILFPFIFSHLKDHQQERLKVFLEAPTNAALAAISPIISETTLKKLQANKEKFFTYYENVPVDNKQKDNNTEQQTPNTSNSTAKEENSQIAAASEANAGNVSAPVKTIKKKKKKPNDWNAQQSLLAVGSGGISGKGFLKGTQHVLGYLPKSVAPTDFIFSVIAEETGFFGSLLLLLCFSCIILCGCRTALLSHDQFGVCLALGTSVIFATHTFINIAMTVQAAPIIGIPLPFVSYGGSFMLTIMSLAGLSQSVHIHQANNEQEQEN